ncbi:hypothetical protein SVAN01_07590 [Stagonosporopsis vannaccii]|nr:hypothetical protein SVAN01_07590 [Stagonosporopsis vannaccii]
MPPTSSFLRFPTELRYLIYDQLCPLIPHSHPYAQPSPIAAIDTTGPPISLLLVNHALHEEIRAYYFKRCTFRFVAQSFSHAKNLRGNMHLGSLAIVRNMRKVEVLLLPGTMRAGRDTQGGGIGQGMSAAWLEDQVGLLRDEAGALRSVTVSVRRVSWNHGWCVLEEMEALLRPLKTLMGRVEFRVGEVMGPGDIEEEMLQALGMVIEKLNR